jgi:hypothetical protein
MQRWRVYCFPAEDYQPFTYLQLQHASPLLHLHMRRHKGYAAATSSSASLSRVCVCV